MKWRFLETGAKSPAMNMAIDEAIMCCHRKGLIPPTLRFYTWEPAGLTLGYFQKFTKEINEAGCNRYGVEYVRRLTGGRAVLHDRDFTYSIIICEENPKIPKGILPSYREISKGIINGLTFLDIQAEVVALNEDKQKKDKKEMSIACFDSASWYEVVIEGKKIVGSAQTRKEGILLQHGSILLDLDSEKLFNVLQTPSDKVKERMIRDFPKRAVSLSSLLKKKISYEELISPMRQGFAEAFSVDLEESTLLPEELELAQMLYEEKYTALSWNTKK